MKNQKLISGIISLVAGFYFIIDNSNIIWLKLIGWILLAFGLGLILIDLK